VILLWLGAERLEVGVGVHLLLGCLDGREAGLGEGFEAEVAAAFDPVVVLLGEDGADESDERTSVREDADDVGPAADLSVEPFLGYLESFDRCL